MRALERKGFVAVEQVQTERDPLRSPAEKLRVESLPDAAPPARLPKAERELLAFLHLHPGAHNLKEVEAMVRNASPAARALARRKLVKLAAEPLSSAPAGPMREPHSLNPSQQAAFARIRDAVIARRFETFLLHGVTGSGKTEVYLSAIETALGAGRGALLLVPEIALTPAMAGQFFSRFGDRVGHPAQRLHRYRAERPMAAHTLRAPPAWWWARARASSPRCETWASS